MLRGLLVVRTGSTSSSSSSSSPPPGLAYAAPLAPCAAPAPAGAPPARPSSPSSKYASLPPRLAAARRRSSSSRSPAAPGSAALRAARRIAASSPSSSSLMLRQSSERGALRNYCTGRARRYTGRYSHTPAPRMPKPLPAHSSRLNSRAAAVFIATGCFCFAASRKARAPAPFPALPAFESPMAAAVMLSAVERSAVVDRVRGALWGIHIADALSMPVHWYYDPRALQRDFGRITDYAPPKKEHPSSIMSGASRLVGAAAEPRREPALFRVPRVTTDARIARSEQHRWPRPRRPGRAHHRRRYQPWQASILGACAARGLEVAARWRSSAGRALGVATRRRGSAGAGLRLRRGGAAARGARLEFRHGGAAALG